MSLAVDATPGTVEARERIAEILRRAAGGKKRILVTRRGKLLAVLGPVDDLESLKKLEEVKKELGLRQAGLSGIPITQSPRRLSPPPRPASRPLSRWRPARPGFRAAARHR
jgi:prevent-host-death family protein